MLKLIPNFKIRPIYSAISSNWWINCYPLSTTVTIQKVSLLCQQFNVFIQSIIHSNGTKKS